ncbi:unnamed protein product, partial [Discosporangium mesarthrocarpum]
MNGGEGGGGAEGQGQGQGQGHGQAEEDELEAIAVPVHGLGTVSVISSPMNSRPRPATSAPVAFAIMDVKGMSVDAQILPCDGGASTDVKIQVAGIQMSHVASPSPHPVRAHGRRTHSHSLSASTLLITEAKLRTKVPIFTWGVERDPEM